MLPSVLTRSNKAVDNQRILSTDAPADEMVNDKKGWGDDEQEGP